ncbi:hypothetical protein DFAR_560001 [Desulfarculales bacterium]
MYAITQFQEDSNPILPIILAGQNDLTDLLIYRISLPLTSRVVARSYLAGVSLKDMRPTSCNTSKLQAPNRTSSLIRSSPPYSRAPASSSEEPTTWLKARL